MTARQKPPHMSMSISLKILDTRGRRQKMTHEINAPIPTRIEFHLSVSLGEIANCNVKRESSIKNIIHEITGGGSLGLKLFTLTKTVLIFGLIFFTRLHTS